MSWLTDALDQMNREIVYKSPNNIASAYACGMQRARTIILGHYVQHAEKKQSNLCKLCKPRGYEMTEKLIKILNELVDESSFFTPADFAYLNYSDLGITYVDEKEIGENRWSDVMLTVVKFDGKLYGIEWLRGATEMQENEVDFYSGTVYEVEEYQVVETKYKKV